MTEPQVLPEQQDQSLVDQFSAWQEKRKKPVPQPSLADQFDQWKSAQPAKAETKPVAEPPVPVTTFYPPTEAQLAIGNLQSIPAPVVPAQAAPQPVPPPIKPPVQPLATPEPSLIERVLSGGGRASQGQAQQAQQAVAGIPATVADYQQGKKIITQAAGEGAAALARGVDNLTAQGQTVTDPETGQVYQRPAQAKKLPGETSQIEEAAKGTAQGLAEKIQDFAPWFLAGEGIGATVGAAIQSAPAIVQAAVRTMVSAGWTYPQLSSAIENGMKAKDIAQEKGIQSPEFIEAAGQASADALFAFLSAVGVAHGVRSTGGALSKEYLKAHFEADPEAAAIATQRAREAVDPAERNKASGKKKMAEAFKNAYEEAGGPEIHVSVPGAIKEALKAKPQAEQPSKPPIAAIPPVAEPQTAPKAPGQSIPPVEPSQGISGVESPEAVKPAATATLQAQAQEIIASSPNRSTSISRLMRDLKMTRSQAVAAVDAQGSEQLHPAVEKVIEETKEKLGEAKAQELRESFQKIQDTLDQTAKPSTDIADQFEKFKAQSSKEEPHATAASLPSAPEEPKETGAPQEGAIVPAAREGQAVASDSNQSNVEAAGATYRGVQEGFGKTPAQIMFNDPETGTTLNVPLGSSVEQIRAKMEESREKFRQAKQEMPDSPNETKQPWEAREEEIEKKVKESRGSGAVHLDTVPYGVEALRGLHVRSLRDGGGYTVVTADNRDEIHVIPDGKTAADTDYISRKEAAEFVVDGKRPVKFNRTKDRYEVGAETIEEKDKRRSEAAARVNAETAAKEEAGRAPSTPNSEKFAEVYAKHLAQEIDKNPEQYRYGKDKIPAVVAKMIEAMRHGTANLDSVPIQKAMKDLGIRVVGKAGNKKALQEFLGGVEEPAKAATSEQAEAAKPEESRAKYSDGRLIPVEGEKVFQVVRGFGGSPAHISGDVYKDRGKLRVRVTGTHALIGGGGGAGKTYPLSDQWTVVGDPLLAERQAAAEKREQERNAAREAERAAEESAISKNIEENGLLTAKELEIGERLENVVTGDKAKIGTIDPESGDVYVWMDGQSESQAPGYAGNLNQWKRVNPKPSAPAKKVQEPVPDAKDKAALQAKLDDATARLEAARAKIEKQGFVHTPLEELRARGELLKEVAGLKDEMAVVNGEPTSSEKRALRDAMATKSFANRPGKAMKYSDLEQSQSWQVMEGDYIDRRFETKANEYERAIKQAEQEISGMKDGTKPRAMAEDNVRFWKQQVERLKAHDPKSAEPFKSEYLKIVKQAVSHGKPVPEEVIQQKPEFTLAKTARERYEKGRHTSFANRSAAVNDVMQKEEGYKVKRQDGTPITDEQIKRIKDAVSEITEVLGPLANIMRGVDLTIVHTNGKFPFLMNDAAGLYSEGDRRITMGLRIPFFGEQPVFAHEFGHFVDIQGGKVLGETTRVRTKSGKGYSLPSLAEAQELKDSNSLMRRARYKINNARDVQEMLRMYGKKSVEELTEEQQGEVARAKVMLSAYWREPREIFARLFEQYIANEMGKKGVSVSSPEKYANMAGWWTQKDFDEMRPQIVEEIGKRMNALREAYDPKEVVTDAIEASDPALVAVEADPESIGEHIHELREDLGVSDKATLDSYDPAKSVEHLGKKWVYRTLQGNLGGGLFDTRKEAIEAATRHKAIKQEQYDGPEGFRDIVSVRARKRLALIKKYEAEGMGEMEAGQKARADVPDVEQSQSATEAPDPIAIEDQITQALSDWKSNRAYIDNNGNYHVKTEGESRGPIASWNAAAKRRFASTAELHEAAKSHPADKNDSGNASTTPDEAEGSDVLKDESARYGEKIQAKVSTDHGDEWRPAIIHRVMNNGALFEIQLEDQDGTVRVRHDAIRTMANAPEIGDVEAKFSKALTEKIQKRLEAAHLTADPEKVKATYSDLMRGSRDSTQNVIVGKRTATVKAKKELVGRGKNKKTETTFIAETVDPRHPTLSRSFSERGQAAGYATDKLYGLGIQEWEAYPYRITERLIRTGRFLDNHDSGFIAAEAAAQAIGKLDLANNIYQNAFGGGWIGAESGETFKSVAERYADKLPRNEGAVVETKSSQGISDDPQYQLAMPADPHKGYYSQSWRDQVNRYETAAEDVRKRIERVRQDIEIAKVLNGGTTTRIEESAKVFDDIEKNISKNLEFIKEAAKQEAAKEITDLEPKARTAADAYAKYGRAAFGHTNANDTSKDLDRYNGLKEIADYDEALKHFGIKPEEPPKRIPVPLTGKDRLTKAEVEAIEDSDLSSGRPGSNVDGRGKLKDRGWVGGEYADELTDLGKSAVYSYRQDRVEEAAGFPMSKYEPLRTAKIEPLTGRYGTGVTSYKNEPWHTEGHVAVKGDAPAYWPKPEEGMKGPNIEPVVPKVKGETIKPIGFGPHLRQKDANDKIIYFDNGAGVDRTYFDYINKRVAPTKWTQEANDKAMQAWGNDGKLVAILMPLRIETVPVNLQPLLKPKYRADVEAAGQDAEEQLRALENAAPPEATKPDSTAADEAVATASSDVPKDEDGYISPENLGSRSSGEKGAVRMDLLAMPITLPLQLAHNFNNWWERHADRLIQAMKIGRRFPEVEAIDPEMADALRFHATAAQYYREVFRHWYEKYVAPMGAERERLAFLMADQESRDNLLENHPEEFNRAMDDDGIREALDALEPLQEEVREARVAMGGVVAEGPHVRRVYPEFVAGLGEARVRALEARAEELRGDLDAAVEDGEDTRLLEERYRAAAAEARLARRKLKTGGMFPAFDRVVTKQSVNNKGRVLTPEEHYERGTMEFGPSFGPDYVGTMNKLAEHNAAAQFMSKAVHLGPNESAPAVIYWDTTDGPKPFFNPDWIKAIKETGKNGTPEERQALAEELGIEELPKPKDVEPYDYYFPDEGSRFRNKAAALAHAAIEDANEGEAVSEETKIKAFNVLRSMGNSYLGPRTIIQNMREQAPEAVGGFLAALRNFARGQIVGFGFGIPHVANLMRSTMLTFPGGLLNPKAWLHSFKTTFDKGLRARGIQGPEDPYFNMLLRHAGLSVEGIAEYKSFLLSLDDWSNLLRDKKYGKMGLEALLFPLRAIGELPNRLAKIGHDVLYGHPGKPGVEMNFRIDYAMRLTAEHSRMEDGQQAWDNGWGPIRVAEEVNSKYGKANRAAWTEQEKKWSKILTFPTWFFRSVNVAVRHLIKATVPAAILVWLANRALHTMGLNSSNDSNDITGIHIGQRVYKPTLLNEPDAAHLMEGPKAFVQGKLRHETSKKAIGEAALATAKSFGKLAVNPLQPMIQAPIEFGFNQAYPGGREIVRRGDMHKRGLLGEPLGIDKLMKFGGSKALPGYSRVFEEALDLPGAAGANLGLPSYRKTPRRR